MTGIENKLLVLCLDQGYNRIGYKTVGDAVVSLCSTNHKNEHKWFAFDIEYSQKSNGEWDFDYYVSATPVPWETWVNLPIRPYDIAISTQKKQIRVPVVIASKNFCKIIKR